LNVRLPDGIGGNFYILIFTDSNIFGSPNVFHVGSDGTGDMARVQEFQGEGNNITAALMPIILTPPPDLQVASVTAQGPDPSQPGHVLSGQSFAVSYTVANNGFGDTPDRQASWTDQIWLSRDQLLS